MNKDTLVFFFFCFFCPNLLFSAEPTPIPQVTITSERESEGEIAGTAIYINTDTYKHRVVSVPEILSEQAGVHLTRYGGLEEATSVSIRGSASDEVIVLYDGIPLNIAGDMGVDLTPIDIEQIESISIYKGGVPSRYGFFPSAGMVALQSKKIKNGFQTLASFGYGSFNTYKGNSLLSKTWERFGFLLSTTYSRTDGDFTFLDDNGTPVNTDDDETIQRRNNEAQTIHPLLKLFYNFDEKTHLEFTTHIVRKDSGVPGLSANQSETADLSQTHWLTSLRLKREGFFRKNINIENLIYFRFLKSQFSDMNAEIGLGSGQDNDDTTTLFGNRTHVEAFLGSSQVVTGFLLFQTERFDPKNYLATPQDGLSSTRHQINLGVSDEIELLDHRLFLSPGIWVENVYNRMNNSDPSLAVSGGFTNQKNHHEVSGSLGIKGMMTSYLSLEAHASRAFRFPTFSELFGDKGGVVGNPFLDPQESIQWDGGIVLSRKPQKGFINQYSLRTMYFDRFVDNLIQFQQNSGFARAENVGEARIQGIELEGKLEVFKQVSLSGNYTFGRAKDRAQYEGRYLTGRPKHELNAKVEAWTRKGKTFVSINWLDSNYLDALNTRVVQDRFLLNTGISYEILKNITASFEAKNLTNDQIVDVVGFPLPGRSFFGRISWKIN